MMAQTMGMGMSMGVPDVCLTPPFAIPIPYPNIANNGVCIPGQFTNMINCMPELTLTAMHPITNGDEAGCMPGGAASGMIIGMGRPLMGSMKVFLGGTPSWRVTAPTLHNLSNCPGVTAVPSQFTKIVLA